MNDPTTPKAKRFRIGWWTPLGLLLAVGGAVLLYVSQPVVSDTLIDRIRISESASLSDPGAAAESAIEKLKRSVGSPDYYLYLITESGEQQTEIKHDMPIGNGLTFVLKTPVLLSQLREVRVMHEAMLVDPVVDRVDVANPVEQGQVFQFNLLAQPTENPKRDYRPIVGWSLLGVGALLLLITLVRFVHQQVV